MADNNKKQFIKYENTTYLLEDHRLPDPTAEDNGKVLGVVNGAYALKQEQGGVTFMTAEDIDALWGNVDGLPDGDEVSF